MYTLEKRHAFPTSQMLLTPSKLFTLKFNEKEIIKMFRNLNVHKVHGHDDIPLE